MVWLWQWEGSGRAVAGVQADSRHAAAHTRRLAVMAAAAVRALIMGSLCAVLPVVAWGV